MVRSHDECGSMTQHQRHCRSHHCLCHHRLVVVLEAGRQVVAISILLLLLGFCLFIHFLVVNVFSLHFFVSLLYVLINNYFWLVAG